jgi:hypothetical protein
MVVVALGALIGLVFMEEFFFAFPALPDVVLSQVDGFTDFSADVAVGHGSGVATEDRNPGRTWGPIRLEAALRDGKAFQHYVYQPLLATNLTNHFHQITRSSQLSYQHRIENLVGKKHPW